MPGVADERQVRVARVEQQEKGEPLWGGNGAARLH